MKNTIKALSKQFFGAKYESARKSLLAAVILFIAVYAAEFRVEIAPFILYLTSTFFTAGIMWQMLTGRRHMEIMQGMFMLPFDNRSFVFSYVLVLGAHTLITKTLLIWALFFALPFSGTYVGQQQSTVVDSGLYALCRHPGVLFFAGMYLCAWLFCGRDAMLLTAVSLTLCDVLHVFVQDRVYFPKTLTGYGDYRRRVPFLIPNAASVRRCIHTLHQKEARRS